MLKRLPMMVFGTLLMLSCGGTDLGDSFAIGGSGSVQLEESELPVLLTTNPATLNLSQLPAVLGTAEPEAEVRLFSDSDCTQAEGAGVADSSGSFSISVTTPLLGGT